MNPEQFFKQAKQALNLPENTVLQSSYQFGVDADHLADLVQTGIKTATTSAYDLYEPNEPLPKVGAYDVILNSRDEPICVTKTDDVIITPYRSVDDQHAYQEGKGNRSFAYWKRVHDDFFENEYAAAGKNFNPETAMMVLEKFHVVYPK
ncbi:ASCH domain-containing protein [Apilactobacillus xinyiensis]|uniref:ASCH domain-containing protein n=1 Tax=Apilactobacillus xinyiensis TaxID=2841032 RepID=UPI001C7CBD38|nr:ASCH domain-containing protein [Apilactobacillus xinyiensis]